MLLHVLLAMLQEHLMQTSNTAAQLLLAALLKHQPAAASTVVSLLHTAKAICSFCFNQL
jgi:hypothetical protein